MNAQNSLQIQDGVVIDSNLTLEQALRGSIAPGEILALQVLADVKYWSFDAKLHRGQIVIHRAIEAQVRAIFAHLQIARFPIYQVVPVVQFGWSDDLSMANNNSSAFNYRPIVGQSLNVALPQLSRHAAGLAIDLNPLQNPYIKGDWVLPPNAIYDTSQPGTIVAGDIVTQIFAEFGWRWGGAWTTLFDAQHFETFLPHEAIEFARK